MVAENWHAPCGLWTGLLGVLAVCSLATAGELYPKNRSAALDPALFANPTSEYRGTPFWAWNNKLNEAQLLRQIDYFKAMGLGGYHIHCRTGLDTPYLGEEFLRIVKACADKGKAEGMLTWLYDEDRWPSGFAGGLVTRDPRFRARHLLFTVRPYDEQDRQAENVNTSAARARRMGNGRLLARYAVELDQGRLKQYRRLGENEQAPAGAKVWYAYVETAKPSAWFNHQTYVDTLNPAAIERFVAVTHEAFYKRLGNEFGKTVPAIFTDEPQFVHKQSLARATATNDVVMPFTEDFADTFRRQYGADLLDQLPEVFWELPDGRASLARYRYHDHLAERFAAAFADTIGHWCAQHGIALTGHMMEEPTLQSQTGALGEAMRSYRSFQIPGIDMLCDRPEYTTAKQAQSAAHQYGYPGVLSELYGVTGWDFDFVGHKAQGDWQAALGVTVRVQHLSWVSMAGEAKRDYPASIFYQSPWYREYPTVENHFARLNTVLTRGRPQVRLGVIHPIESYWLCFGPQDQTGKERKQRETSFASLIDWLLFGQVDFNYICEALLPSQNPRQAGQQFTVGRMAYDAVVVPPMRTIRASTLDRLEAFATAGGRLIFAGEVPTLVDAVPSERTARLAERAQRVTFEREPLLAALDGVRDVRIQLAGDAANSLLYQMRADGPRRHLFLCNTDRENPRNQTQIQVRGSWQAILLDTMTGTQRRLPATCAGGWTTVSWDFPAHGHVLLTFEPRQGPQPGAVAPAPTVWTERGPLPQRVPVTLSEPNVVLLDQAAWRLNGGPWQPSEEILRLDNLVRKELGLAPRTGEIAQPWCEPSDPRVLGHLELKFPVRCHVAVAGARLAVEQPEDVEIRLDGKSVAVRDAGWWVDEAIRTVALPQLTPGTHELLVRIAYRRKTNVEWMYVLGDFGVKLEGRQPRIVAPVRELAFGDWSQQGLPFYAGNVTYHGQIEASDQTFALRVAQFKNPLITVDLDGRRRGPVAFAPYEIVLGQLTPGTHRLDLTAYGNRQNAFGCVHRIAEKGWVGPNAWRTAGKGWTYDYRLKPIGILAAPVVLQAGKGQ
jgi:hypothetical protein